MSDKRRAAEALAYLNDPSKILAALANEYGRDEVMPSRVAIEEIIAERRQRRTAVQYAQRRVA